MTHFKAELSGYNWKQFSFPGGKLRAMYRGCNMWSIYLYDQDSDAYIHDAIVHSKENASCKKIYEAYKEIELQRLQDESDETDETEDTEPQDETELLNKLIREKYPRAWNYGNYPDRASEIEAVKDELEDIKDENIHAENLLKELESYRG